MTTLDSTEVTLAPGRVAHPRRWAGLAVLALSLLVVIMDMTILNVALPDLIADLHPSAVSQLWIVDAYPVVLAGLLVPVSAVADRWGRRRMLLSGFALFGLASLLVLFANSPGEVIGLRIALGVAGAMIMPTTLSLISTLFTDPTEHALALGIWAAMASVGNAVGPIVGGSLLEGFSWHSAFLVNVPLMVVAVVAGALLLPESRSARPARLDPAGVILSVGGMVAVVYAIKHLAKYGVDGPTPAILVAGLIMMTVFVRRCLKQDEPMLAVRLFADRVFRAGVLTSMAHNTVVIALLLVGSQWLQIVQGWSPLATGVALLPLALGGLVGAPFAPRVAARVGARAVVTAGLLVTALGGLLLFGLPRPIPYLGLALVLLMVGLGGAALGVASALIMGRAASHQTGSAAAIQEMSFEIGAVLGVSILGSLAGIVYRSGLPAGAGATATESVAGAVGTPLETTAMTSFTNAFADVGLLGAVIVLLACVLVWCWVPKKFSLTGGH